jgi:predicted lipoprotein with Yx(FWY)xxD motif
LSITVHRPRRSPGRRLLIGSLALGAVATAAACGTSSTGTAPGSSSSAPGGTSPAAVTISAKSVPGVGTVLVNGQGQTLYMLTSEKGGKLTCTDASGCTKVWPDTELPKGMTAAKAGSGIQASLLGTVKAASGSLYVTYNGWPLYTFSGDSGPGQAKGEGITNFGGTWYVLGTSGTPVTSMQSPSGSSPSTGSGGGGYGY